MNRILLFLGECSLTDLDVSIEKALGAINLGEFLNKDCSFGVEYAKSASASVDGRLVAGTVGAVLKEKTGAVVQLVHPDVPFLCFIDKDEVYLGIDFSGDDVGKRDYRIFLGHDSLKGNVAFCLLQYAKYAQKTSLLDPFCRAGAIAIEAALYAMNQSPHFFSKNKFAFRKMWFLKDVDVEKLFEDIDKKTKKSVSKIVCIDPMMQNINAARKNAKIAGVLDSIDFSRTEVEWLDLKFDKQSIDRIVTFPPQVSKTVLQKKLEKDYEWLFRNSAHVLKNDGMLLLVCRPVSEGLLNAAAAAHQFVVKEKHVFYQGAEELAALVFKKAE